MPVSKPEVLAHGRFKNVEIFRPQGEVKHFALLMSGDGGWTSRLARMAGALASDGTLVAGIDTAQLFDDLEKDGGNCVLPDGDLENLSHYVQAYYKVPTYFTPILIGHSAGATLAFTSLAQAPRRYLRRRAHPVLLCRPGSAQASVRGAGAEVLEDQERLPPVATAAVARPPGSRCTA